MSLNYLTDVCAWLVRVILGPKWTVLLLMMTSLVAVLLITQEMLARYGHDNDNEHKNLFQIKKRRRNGVIG